MSERIPEPSIADLNDAFRRTCDPYLTPGVMFFPDVPQLIQAIRDFDDFTPDNDPRGEHDMGALDWQAERVLFKIDYDEAMQRSGNATSPDCSRVMTLLLGSEY